MVVVEPKLATHAASLAPGPARLRRRSGARRGLKLVAPLAPARTTVEVVLITRNSRAALEESLMSVLGAAAEADAQVSVIDLGSTDGTRSYLHEHAGTARGVWLEAADSAADAINVAAQLSDRDVLVFLTPGLEPRSRRAISQLVEHLNDHPCTAIAGPVLYDRAGRRLLSAPAIPTGAMLAAARTRTAGNWSRRRLEAASRIETAPAPFARAEAVIGDAVAIRRADLAAADGADSRFSFDLAMLDLGIRLRRRGREVHYLREVEFADASGRVQGAAERLSEPGAAQRLRFVLRHPGHAVRPGLLHGRRLRRALGQAARRAIDICLAGALLVLLAPLLALIAAAIALDSRGPSLFRQQRAGRGGRAFQMYKFRTMRAGSDSSPHEQYVRDMIVNRRRGERDGQDAPQVFKIYPDPRVTRVGRLLRRASLDELPQLYNVLRGDMTFVGFRPPIPYEVEHYPAWYHRRFDGKPGITGLWQVSGRNQRSYEEMVSLDIEYLNRRNWWLDLLLLARTVAVVLSGRGAY
jgi:lipopolysaccharide/colanic/teichoic acid biosynthesis glycosyltransferase